MKTLHLRKSSGRAPFWRAVSLSIALAWFALSPAQAQLPSPTPDGGYYPNLNTAEGTNALFSVTIGGGNTAIGFSALFSNTTGSNNTANGSQALGFNKTGSNNTATGAFAMFSGGENVQPVTGGSNTATGFQALFQNNEGNDNTATGANALVLNTTGTGNTASGFEALVFNSTGNFNTAEGFRALENSTGSNNIALGSNAGVNLTTGSNNIYIGAPGVAGESNTIRIGTVGLQNTAYMRGISGATVASGVTVIVGSTGKLGTVQSCARFKEAIKPMDKASEAILALKPVTFLYKKELDPEGIPQFGLVAEQVEKVNPDLVARDEKGQVYTVRYEAVNAMLLNEFLKEHRKVEELEATLANQQENFQSTTQRQQREIEAVTASLKQQALQIQKVSQQLEMSKAAPQLIVAN
jgi:Chaperone of endosialidase